MFTGAFLLNIVYFSVCLTSNKLYWIEDQLADVSTRFYTSASWTVGELTGYPPGKREALWKSSVLPKNTTHWPAQYLNLELSTPGLVIRGHCLSQCGLLHHHLPLTNTDHPSLYIHLSNKLWLLRIFLLICSILSFYINLYGKEFQVVVFSINILSFEIFSSQARKGRCLYLLQRLVSSV